MVDSNLFTRLWTQTQPIIASYLACHLNDATAVDDLIQETALSLLDGFDRYDPERDFTAWAVGVARHRLVDWWRRQGRRREAPFSDHLMDDIASTVVSMAPELAARRRALRHCWTQMKPDDQALIQARYGGNTPIAELAKRRAVPEGTVRSWLTRLRRRLERCIAQRLTVSEAGT